ncbi:MAG: MotA/TolQ/ExbB proton channel family protein [Nitrospirota bacterium]|jgi:chemotaxis protein MotA
MDIATLLGVVAAFGLVAVAIVQGVGLAAFLDLPSLLIVVGGTVGVVLMNYPLVNVLTTFKAAVKAVIHRHFDVPAMKNRLVELSQRVRRDGLLSIQDEVDSITDPYLKKALEMVVDGMELAAIERILHDELDSLDERHQRGVEIFGSMAAYSPAMGLIGTLIGLVAMLQNMSDPSSIGPAMAVALLTTFYGAILANMVFSPIAGKLKTRSREEILYKEFILIGVVSIAGGENPRVLEQRLHAFLSPAIRVSSFPQPGAAMNKAGAKAW